MQILPAYDEDRDTLQFVIDQGDSSGFFTPSTDGVYDGSYGLFAGHDRYVLRLSDRVQGGAAAGDSPLVVDFEDPDRPSRKFDLLVYVSDGREDENEDGGDGAPLSAVFTVSLTDVNDPPTLEPASYSIVENSPPGTLVATLESADQDWLTLAGLPARSDAHTFDFVPGTDASNLPFTVQSNGDLLVGTAHQLDFETQSSYEVPVRVTDSGGVGGAGTPLFADATFVVRIDDVNEPPTVASTYDWTVDENTPPPTVIGNITAVDQDIDYSVFEADPLTYTVVSGNEDGTFILVGSTVYVDLDQLDFELAPELRFTVSVADPEGAVSLVNVTVHLNDVNDPPAFTSCAPVAEQVAEFTAVESVNMVEGLLDVPELQSAVFNLGGTVNVGTDWDLCRALCAAEPRCAAYTAFTDPESPRYGECHGRTDLFAVAVTVSPPDPTVRSGLRMPVCQRLVMPETAAPPTVVGVPFTVVDVEGHSFTVTIDPATDPSGAFAVTYDSGTNTAVLTVNQDILNFETQLRHLLTLRAEDDGGGGALPAAAATVGVAVILTDVNEYPVYPDQTRVVVELDEAGILIGDPVLATDDDMARGQVLSYELVSGDHDALSYFAMTNDTAQVYLIAKMDQSGFPAFTCTVRATDDEGLATTATLTISVTSLNARPVINNAATVRTVPETAAVGATILPALDFTDANLADTHTVAITSVTPDAGAAYFSVDNAGVFTVASDAINYECARLQPLPNCPAPYRTFTVSVSVMDDGVGSLQAFADLTFAVQPVDEAPELPASLVLEVPENSAADTRLVASPPGTSFPDFYDDDKLPLTFSIGGDADGVFQVAAGQRPLRIAFDNAGLYNTLNNQFPPGQVPVVTVASAVLNHEVTPSYALTLQVNDGGTPAQTIPLTVTVVDVQERPVLAQPSWAYDVDENVPGGTPVGSVSATDPDTDDVIQYVLTAVQQFTYRGTFSFEVPDSASGRLLQRFAVDRLTGAVTVQQPPFGSLSVLDFEEYVSFRLTVQARDRDDNDAAALWADAVVDVDINDVNDVSITSVSTPAGDGLLSTVGGEAVKIEGLNFGPFLGDPALSVAVHYRCDPFAAVDPATGVIPASACAYQAQQCVVSRPNTQITCDSVAGTGANQLWRVEVNGHPVLSSTALATDTAFQSTSYAPPKITGVTAAVLSTRGGESVTLDGSMFGPPDVPVTAKYGNGRYAAPTCDHESQTRVVCTSAEGVGKDHTWVITVDGQSSAPSGGVTAYAPPVLTGVAGFVNPTSGVAVDVGALRTEGGETVVLSGDNFGPLSSVVLPGSTAGDITAEVSAAALNKCLHVACRVVTAHTVLHCTTTAGVGAGYTWAVSVAGQPSGAAPQLTGYHPPQLERVFGDGAFGSPTEGGSLVYVAGRYFGPPASADAGAGRACTTTGVVHDPAVAINVTYGTPDPAAPATDLARHFTALDCQVETPHRLLGCTMGQGTGRNHFWRASVAGQATALLSTATFYAPPFVTQLAGDAAPSARTEGDQQLIVVGNNFGTDLSVITRVSYGPSGVEFDARDCVIAEPHTRLHCLTSEGVGAGLGFSVVVDGQASSVPRTTYLPPSNVSIVGLQTTGYSTRGGQPMVVTGSDFGTVSPRYLETVTFGDDGEYFLRNCAMQADHVRVACEMPAGVGAGHRLVVTVEGQASTPSLQSFSYRPPVILGVVWMRETVTPGVDGVTVDYLPVGGLPTTGATLRVVGTDLGTLGDGLEVFTGEEAATKALLPKVYEEVSCTFDELDSVPLDAYCLQFQVPPGDGLAREVAVEVGGQSSTAAGAWSYSYGDPFIEERIVQQSETNRRHKIITLRGENFGLSGTVVVSPDNTTSAEELVQRYRAGDPGTTACVQEEYGHTFIRCVLQEVRGEPVDVGYIAVEVGVDARVSNLQQFVQLSPSVLSYDPQVAGTAERPVVTITGQYLGSLAEQSGLRITIGNRTCTIVESSYVELTDPVCDGDGLNCSPSQDCDPGAGPCSPRTEKRARVQCRAPLGEGRDNELVAHMFEDKSAPKPFHYQPPRFRLTDPLTGVGADRLSPDADPPGWSTRGTVSTGEWATLHGTNFGLFPRVVINGTVLPYSDVRTDDPVDHTQISFRVPPGQGLGYPLHVLVGAQSTDSAPSGQDVLLHYAPPVIYGFHPPTLAGPTQGGTIVTLTGDNFGAVFAGTIALRDSETNSLVHATVLSWNDTYAQVQMPAWQGAGLQLQVSVDGQQTAQLPSGTQVRRPAVRLALVVLVFLTVVCVGCVCVCVCVFC